jgi:hypothetical protein
MKIENSQVAPIVNKILIDKINKAVKIAHDQMISDFESHPVTKEIESGVSGWNQSGTLSGYGNLYTFIGFEEGMDPIAPIRYLLEKAISVKIMPPSQKSMVSNFLIELPSKQEIFSASPMPWAEGRSWAEGIEKGISGLGYYLNKLSFKSRSEEGIQAKTKIRNGAFKNTKYLSNILNDLSRNIRRGVK